VAVVARKRKGSHGGARPGSGRHQLFENRQGLTVQLERTDYDALAELAHERRASIGTVVREAIRTYLARRKKG
jgi:hypothetical protein